MGTGRAARHLRWAGVGRTGRGHAGVGRIVSLFERNLRAAEAGTAHIFSLYLATVFQRSAVDCIGRHRAFAICGFFLAGSGARLVDPHRQPQSAADRNSTVDLGCDAGHAGGHRRLRTHSFPALPADHGDFAAHQPALAGRDGNDWMDHRCRAYSFQCASGIRFTSGRVLTFAQLLSWTRRGNADRRLRHRWILQRLFPRRRGQGTGEKYSAGAVPIHSGSRVSLYRDERQHSRRHPVAGDGARRARRTASCTWSRR